MERDAFAPALVLLIGGLVLMPASDCTHDQELLSIPIALPRDGGCFDGPRGYPTLLTLGDDRRVTIADDVVSMTLGLEELGRDHFALQGPTRVAFDPRLAWGDVVGRLDELRARFPDKPLVFDTSVDVR